MDSVSYSLGVLVAQNLKQQGLDSVNAESFANGIEDVLQDNELQISTSDANQIVQNHLNAQNAKKYEEKIQAGKAFLQENAKRETVTEMPSGLQYEVLQPGQGESPSAQDTVKVHYHGELLDGTVFDSSVERNEPVTFGVKQVIPGWVEALQLMKPGAKWKLYVPYDLAYGERGAGPKIGPYETLVFQVQLLEVK